MKCRYCGKQTKKLYIIADDLEHPKPYHKKCYDKLIMDCFIAIAKDELNINKNKNL